MKKSIFAVLSLVFVLVLLAAGCADENVNYDTGKVDAYLLSVEEQSEAIKTSLEQDVLTQTEMNMKSQELCELWDSALDYLWNELEQCLSKDEFAKLQDEQNAWTADKEKAMDAAGKEYEGGSFYAFVVNAEAAKLTEERVYELYELLKK